MSIQMRCRTVLPILLTLAVAPYTQGALEFETTTKPVEAKWNDVVITAGFPFQNPGPETVRILDLRADCSCSKGTLHLNKLAYAPGEKGLLTFSFTPGDRLGLQTPHIVLRTDLATQKEVSLTLTTDIPDVLGLSSRILYWSSEEQASLSSKKIQISMISEVSSADLVLCAPSEHFNAQIVPGTTKESKVLILEPKGRLPAGLREKIKLEIRSNGTTILEHNVFACAR